jgi:alpha-glucosidase
MVKFKTYLLILLLFSNSLFAQKQVQLTSPDGNIVFTIFANENIPSYSISYKKNNLIKNASLNLNIEGVGMMQKTFIAKATLVTEINENYKLIVGKSSVVNNHYKQIVVSFQDKTKNKFQIDIEVKIFNDGVAFRYLFPKQNGRSSFTLLEEKTQFKFVGNPIVKALLLPNYVTSHEGLYTTLPLSKITADTLMDMPALFQLPNKIFVAITEAALLDYAGMYLVKHKGILQSQLSPLPDQNAVKVKATLPHNSPWRVLLINDRVGVLLESNIITSLNEPTTIKDVSWIQPGTTTFPWWNGTIIPDSGVVGGNNFSTNKYYIDFCAANNIKYHTVVEYGGHEWYTNDGEGYQPGKNVDVTKPVAGLDMQQICDYAKQKNVGVRVWVHWKALYPKLDEAFALFEQWGIAGMMVDFMDRDDQEMVNIQTEILQRAAAHHLHIQFHGAYKPTGLARTYPNEFTREGTLNYETYKWNDIVTPNADLDIAFTRLIAGSTDYHLGGFNAFGMPHSGGRGAFKVQYSKPYVMGTRCHMLAMYVVLENEQGMVCDYPDAYIGQPGFDVLQNMPVTWDETKVVAAEVGKYICTARRKNSTWYIGTINDSITREITIDFSFLPHESFSGVMYSDANDVMENANHLTKQPVFVNNASKQTLKLASGGGNVIILNNFKP